MRAIIVFLLFVSQVFSEDCTLDVSDPDSPFIVTANLTFPTYDVNTTTFTIPEDDAIDVVCPKGTQSSYLKGNGSQLICAGGTNLTDMDTTTIIDFSNIKCKTPGAATVEPTGTACANDTGAIYHIGLIVYDDLLSMITICFDETNLTPIYVQYPNINSDSTRMLEELAAEPDDSYNLYICNASTVCSWSDSGSLYNGTNIDQLYSDQAEILESLSVVNDDNVTLVKYPLATITLWHLNVQKNGQEIQKVPYYDYINVVPVWNSVESLSVWFYVMDTNVADSGKIGSNITTGALGVATLPDDSDAQVELYLSGDKVAVPKWLWLATDQIKYVLFYYNSPNLEDAKTEIDKICSDHLFVIPNLVFNCSYDLVTDPQMLAIISEINV